MKTQRTTPEWLANKMAGLAISPHTIGLSEVHVLEPSAGTGTLLDALREYDVLECNITAVELNKEMCSTLASKGYNTLHGDFMKIDFDQKFDVILAAPPFIANSDVHHIQKMYSLLDNYGTIITLTTPYWTVNNEPHQVAFRDFLKDKPYSMEMLPDNTFMEKGKTVPTALMTIYKTEDTL